MIRHEDTSPEGLKKAFAYINSFGYDSCMLTYHSRENDMFIKLARAIDPDLPLKYIIAMRTYAISPEYLGLMVKGFEEIAKDKIMFNIVAGDLHANETSVEDVVDSSLLSTSQDRVKYTGLWLEKFTNLEILNGRLPKMLENLEFLSKFDTRCVSLQICIRDTDEEADEVKHANYEGDKLKWCYFYSEDTLLKKIMDLKRNGVTDIMVTGLPFDPEVQRVHEFIKKNLEAFNG
jgi:hypothetical protein